METGNLTTKELKDQDLIQIHRELYRKLIKDKVTSTHHRKIALAYYDLKININNIRNYYNHHITVFAQALLNQDLEKITKYQSFG